MPRSTLLAVSAVLPLSLAAGAARATLDIAWSRVHSTAGHDNEPVLAAFDGEGNLVVLGESRQVTTGAPSVFLLKYAPDGALLWTRNYTGADGQDTVADLEIDGAGNIYVAVNTILPFASSDWATAKFSPAGDQIWSRRYTGELPYGQNDATHLAVGADGSVTVCGSAWNPGTARDFAAVRYDAGGDQVWDYTSSFAGPSWEEADGVAIDAQGNSYVTGQITTADATNDVHTVKLSPAGEVLWARQYDLAAGEDAGEALAVGPDGNIHISATGFRGDESELVYLKYSPAGDLLVDATHGVPVLEDNRDVLFGLGGVVYHVGFVMVLTHEAVAFDAAGQRIWSTNFPSAQSGSMRRVAAVDAEGNLVVLGSEHTNGNQQLVLERVAPDGLSIDHTTIEHDPVTDVPCTVTSSADGRIAALGHTLYEPAHRAVTWMLTLPASCAADFDGSGTLSLNDFVQFRNAYVSGDLRADFDQSGSLTLNDFVQFRNAYTAGCP